VRAIRDDRGMVTNQRRKLAEGREAEIFPHDDTTVLKLFRTERPVASIESEAAAMNAVRAAGGPAPEARGIVREDGRPGLLIERVAGQDMLTLLGKKPWMVWRYGRILGEAHAALHDVAAPPELALQKQRLRMHIEAAASDAPEHRALADFVLAQLDALPQGDRICHGDYHPGNVLLTASGPVVIDWPGATAGDPHADVARTLLLLDISQPPPGSPSLVRALARYARRIIRSSYLASYRRARALDDDLLARWRIPIAGARAHDGIEDEVPALLEILQTAMAAR
jgi:aminoglycoside phosphotransferase (APT) family kinase protein